MPHTLALRVVFAEHESQCSGRECHQTSRSILQNAMCVLPIRMLHRKKRSFSMRSRPGHGPKLAQTSVTLKGGHCWWCVIISAGSLSLQSTTSSAVSRALRALFARYIPNVLVTDNGPQFAAAEFATFASKWGFQHVTSSPRYPQSNGKAENAVKTVKRLFSKCSETGQSEFLALLDWRNTPTEGLGSSPAQRFLGRRCRTQLPMTETLLKPAYDTRADARALQGKREERRDGPLASVRASKVLAVTASEWAKQSIAETDGIYSKAVNCQQPNSMRLLYQHRS